MRFLIFLMEKCVAYTQTTYLHDLYLYIIDPQ